LGRGPGKPSPLLPTRSEKEPDPETLNDWLLHHNGYSYFGNDLFNDVTYGRLFFITKSRGVLAADKGQNYITKDEGRTWERIRSPVVKSVWHVSELFGHGNKD
jgi:hypothetical protein